MRRTLGLIAVALASQTLAPASSTAAATSGDHGLIAFTRYAHNGSALFLVDLSNGHAVRLTHGGASDDYATWSPDGRRIVFERVSLDHKRQGLFLIDVRERKVKTLTSHSIRGTTGTYDLAPSWSPGGGKLVFARGNPFGGSFALYLLDLRGNARKLVASGFAPSWDPSGHRFAFAKGKGARSEIFIVNADGRGERQLTHDNRPDANPAWAPDGRTIAYSSTVNGNADIYTIDPSGRKQRRLTFTAADEFFPSWSPDARRLAFTSRRSGHFQIYTMDSEGRHQRRLTRGVEDDLAPRWQPNRHAR